MKKKLKIQDIIASDQAFAKIQEIERGSEDPFVPPQAPSFKLGYRLSKICKKIAPDVESYREQMKKFIKEHGEQIKEGKKKGNYTLENAKKSIKDKFEKESTELLEAEVEVDFEPIPFYLFEQDEMKFPTEVLVRLMWCIDEDATTPPESK